MKKIYLLVGGITMAAGIWIFLGTKQIGPGCIPVLVGNVPAVIDGPGQYCLPGDMSLNGTAPAIRVAASDVVLNLANRSITGNPDEIGQYGIILDDGIGNVEIHGGVIRHVDFGIKGHAIRNLRVTGTIFEKVNSFGLLLQEGQRQTLEKLTFRQIGFANDASAEESYSVAIQASGDDINIRQSRFEDIMRQPVSANKSVGEGVAILLGAGARDIVIENNWFSGNSLDNDQIAVWGRVENLTLSNNRFTNIEWIMGGAYSGVIEITGNMAVLSGALPKFGDTPVRHIRHFGIHTLFSEGARVAFRTNVFVDYPCAITISQEGAISLDADKNFNRLSNGISRCDNDLAEGAD